MKLIYDVVFSKLLSNLINQVNERLENGWELQGGISFLETDDYYYYYCQAMIKKVV